MKDPIQRDPPVTIIFLAIVALIVLSIVHVSALNITMTGSLSMPLDPRTSPNKVNGTLSVSPDPSTGYTVTVADAMDTGKTHAGHMVEYTGGSYGTQYLAANMTVISDSSGAADDKGWVTLTGPNSQPLLSTDTNSSVSSTIEFSQAVGYSDPRLPNNQNYQIVVEFDVSDNT